MKSPRKARKVLLLEMNEITWTIASRLVRQGELPHFERLTAEGTTAAPKAIEPPPYLDPWISWVTLHTGVDMSVHGAKVLEQDESTISARRTWEYALSAGKSIGVFGTIGAYPPKSARGFIVPGPFAPGSETYPEYLRPVQELNRKYTKVHHKNVQPDSPWLMAKMGIELMKLGLSRSTCAKIAFQLAAERVRPHLHWRRVSLQPYINFDFFSAIYREVAPDFATWHSNHCAHYQHHYWRAWDDSELGVRATQQERRSFGEAIPHGYRVFDEILGRFLELIDDDTVLVIASALGQKPYVHELYPEGKVCVKIKNIRRILELVGAPREYDLVPVMEPRWNIRIVDPIERARVRDALLSVRRDKSPSPDAFAVDEVGEILTVTPLGLSKRDGAQTYFFKASDGVRAFNIRELFEVYGDTPKEGMHDPTGVLLLHGPGIERGRFIRDTTSLDIAPTLLALMGIEKPEIMQGRVLSEAWEKDSSRTL